MHDWEVIMEEAEYDFGSVSPPDEGGDFVREKCLDVSEN